MILKNLAAICREHKRIYLYDGGPTGAQWVGDGNAFYPLHGLPKMDKENILNVFDVPEKKRNKFSITYDYWLPETLDFEDIARDRETMLRPEEISIGYMGAVLYPVKTSLGLAFYNQVYLKPLEDKLPKIELYERTMPGGSIYFAAKAGTFLEAIIMPEDVCEENLLQKLQDLTAELKTTVRCDGEDEMREEEEEDLLTPNVLAVDPETGEVLE